MSPILANIYLSELDRFMEEYKSQFDIGKTKRRVTKEYSRLNGTHERLRKKYNKLKNILPEAERKTLLKQMRKVQFEKLNLFPYPVHDTAYKRIQYNRYDWHFPSYPDSGQLLLVWREYRKALTSRRTVRSTSRR